MAKILVTYYSKTGKTESMAKEVIKGVEKEGVDCDLINIESFDVNSLIKYAGIIMGSPTYYGLPAAEIKKVIDESVRFHGKLAGKVGGAFTSAGNIGGGNETTILAILQAFIVHGMIVQGAAQGDHYGPVSIGSPDERAIIQCKLLGENVAKLVKKLGL